MNKTLTYAILATSILSSPAFAGRSEIKSLKNELKQIKTSYEQRISDLENKLNKDNNTVKSSTARNIRSNNFNPSIGIVLNGQYASFSEDQSEIAGFAIGEEGARGEERFSIGESELNFSANIDDKFYGSITAAIVREEGEDKIELEESYLQTTSNFPLPSGLELKIGRAFWNIGYLNEHHAHADDFADRPLTHRVYLNKSFNDDGIQASYILPTNFYSEIGGGIFRGNDTPFGGGDGNSNYSAYFRVGGDIDAKQNWRLGGTILSGEAKAGREGNEGAVTFIGDTDLYIADLRYNFAPTGNAKNKEITLQAEYFYRDENGIYNAGTGDVDFDDNNSAWYAQAVYKFAPEWRIGARYTQILASDTPAGLVGTALDAGDHDPDSYSAMIDWTNSEFSRVRLQYNKEELSENKTDDQFIIQYVASFGAHGAHKY